MSGKLESKDLQTIEQSLWTCAHLAKHEVSIRVGQGYDFLSEGRMLPIFPFYPASDTLYTCEHDVGVYGKQYLVVETNSSWYLLG